MNRFDVLFRRIQKGYKQFRLALSRAALGSLAVYRQVAQFVLLVAQVLVLPPKHVTALAVLCGSGKIERSYFGFFEVRYRRLVDVGVRRSTRQTAVAV